MTVPESAGLVPRGQRRERRKCTTRQDLILAGRSLFGEKGLYESRIEDLSSLAGIAKGTLYGYFGSKEDLIEAVEEHGFRELLAYVGSRVQATESRTTRIRSAVEAHLEFFDDHPDLVRVFHQVRGMLKFNRREWERLRPGLIHYVDHLAALIESGRGRTARPTQRARRQAELLFGIVSGVASLEIVLTPPPRRAALSRMADVVADAVLAGVQGEDGRRSPRRSPRT